MRSYDEMKAERQRAVERTVNVLLTKTENSISWAMASGRKTATFNFTRDVAEDIQKAYAEKLKELGYTFTIKKMLFGKIKKKFIFKL